MDLADPPKRGGLVLGGGGGSKGAALMVGEEVQNYRHGSLVRLSEMSENISLKRAQFFPKVN